MKNIATLLLGAMTIFSCAEKKQENTLLTKPNLLVIHTDEHNFRTLSCYQKLMSEDQAFVWGKGNNVKTPNIDRIANEGAICNRYYASSPVCCPSRASMVSGLYPAATGVVENGQHLSKNVETIGHTLSKAGYATSYVGKWHLDGDAKYQFGIKYKAGFQDNRYMMSGGHAPYFQKTDKGLVALQGKRGENLPKEEVVHLTDYFVDRTLEVLERDKNKPFCIFLSIPDPHTPDYARPPYNTMYANMDVQAPKTFDQQNANEQPKWGKRYKGDKNQAKEFNPDALRQYFGMVKHIDDRVGDLLAFLDKNNLRENTIVVFTSDHGDMFFEHNRKNKDLPYDASAKIPFVIRYPERIPSGKVLNKAYCNIDMVPTMLGLMNVKSTVKYDGNDTSEDFISSKIEDPNRMIYITFQTGIWTGMFDDRYKLILSKQDHPVLFDKQKDPDELVNFYNDPTYKTIREHLQNQLIAKMQQHKEPGLTNGTGDFIYE